MDRNVRSRAPRSRPPRTLPARCQRGRPSQPGQGTLRRRGSGVCRPERHFLGGVGGGVATGALV